MKLTLIVKPTEACNASCAYCSVADKQKKTSRMSATVLEALFRRIHEFLEERPADEVQVTWHGGEPLLMGPDFYLAAHGLQQKILGRDAQRVHHAFQTNLTLFSDSFAEVFRLLGVRSVGSSYESHEGLRRLGVHDAAGAYDRLFFRGLRALERMGIPAGLIYVVTSLTLPRPVEALLFAANIVTDRARTGVRFNRLYREGEAKRGEQASLAVSADQFGHFLGKLFTYWLPRRLVLPAVEPCASLYNDVASNRGCSGCEDSGSCGTTHLGIGPDGTMYQCGRSMDAGILSFGSLEDNGFISAFDHPAKRLLNERSERLASTDCAGCRFFPHCHGGCPVDGHRETADFMNRGGACEAKRIYLGEYVEPLMGVTFRGTDGPSGVDAAGIPS